MKSKYIYINEIIFLVGLALLIAASLIVVTAIRTGITTNAGATLAASGVISTLRTFSLIIEPLGLIIIIFMIIVFAAQFKEFTK